MDVRYFNVKIPAWEHDCNCVVCGKDVAGLDVVIRITNSNIISKVNRATLFCTECYQNMVQMMLEIGTKTNENNDPLFT